LSSSFHMMHDRQLFDQLLRMANDAQSCWGGSDGGVGGGGSGSQWW